MLVVNIKHLKKDDSPIKVTLYKETTGCYRYSIDQIYQRPGAILSTQNRDYTAGSLKATAIKKFDDCIKRLEKRGYKVITQESSI